MRATGAESETPVTQSWATRLSRAAARENNELGARRWGAHTPGQSDAR
jgi:hypothetical protein